MSKLGLLTCSRYAFPPNQLQYCGPDEVRTIIDYQKEQTADEGLAQIIKEFHTLYPYLVLIAHENGISDPFDQRVVEAYWIGNNLLENVSLNEFYNHFTDTLGLKKRIKKKDFEYLVGKIPQGALPHHSFHVLNVFTRTGHHTVDHTLETMDECRIGWGKVLPRHSDLACPEYDRRVSESKYQPITNITVETEPLVLQHGKLNLGAPVTKVIQIPLGNRLPKTVYRKPDTYVSFHWSTFCDVISPQQAKNLKRYTLNALHLANQTL